MKLHLAGGFLGSGKTTAIIEAAKILLQKGYRVGVVTNDQGKYLVDTAFMQANHLPSVEVTGGCFCCNYAELETQLKALQTTASPDIIFAEAVGSCTDLTATVIKPLQAFAGQTIQPSSFSVFADGRLLRRRLENLPLPFSQDVTYIFDKQLEEASLLLANKIDLLDSEAARTLPGLAKARYPDKQVHLQNSLEAASVAGWVALLEAREARETREAKEAKEAKEAGLTLPQASLDLDYDRYGRGEANLAWLDQKISLTNLNKQPDSGRALAIALIGGIKQAIHIQGWPIGHLKFFIQDEHTQAKISFTGQLEANQNETNWQTQLPALAGDTLTLLINARVETKAEALSSAIQHSVNTTLNEKGLTNVNHTQIETDVFHPALPKPTHRLS